METDDTCLTTALPPKRTPLVVQAFIVAAAEALRTVAVSLAIEVAPTRTCSIFSPLKNFGISLFSNSLHAPTNLGNIRHTTTPAPQKGDPSLLQKLHRHGLAPSHLASLQVRVWSEGMRIYVSVCLYESWLACLRAFSCLRVVKNRKPFHCCVFISLVFNCGGNYSCRHLIGIE